MSNSAMISSGIETNNRGILHTQGQEPGEDTFRTCSFAITLFKGFGTIIDIFPYIIISSKVGSASFSIDKFGRKREEKGGILFYGKKKGTVLFY